MSTEEQNSEGNVSLNNVEKFDYEGKEVIVGTRDDGQQVILTPEGLTEEQEEKFKNQAPSLIAALNKKNFDAKRELESLDLKRKELELRERELNLMQAQNRPEPKEMNLMSLLGVTTAEEVIEITMSDPVRYTNAVVELAANKSNAVSEATLAQLSIKSNIQADGYSVSEVEAFMRSHSIGNLSSAYNLYKIQNARTTNPSQGVKRNMQSNAPEILPAGGLTKKVTEEQKLQKKWDDVKL